MNAEPKTAEEFWALPVVGGFGMRTEEIDGVMRRIPFLESTPEIVFVADDTVQSCDDEYDRRWRICRRSGDGVLGRTCL